MHELRVQGGKKHEQHLCEQCARELGIAVPGSISVPELIEKMITAQPAPEPPKAQRAAPAVQGQSCPSCGMTYAEFRQSGQLGCPGCYKAFEAQLGPLLERWHEGGSHHVGKIPARAAGGIPPGSAMPGQGVRLTHGVAQASPESLLGGESERRQKLELLRRHLDEAVAAEQYERAAALRDEIRRLAGPGGAPGGAAGGSGRAG